MCSGHRCRRSVQALACILYHVPSIGSCSQFCLILQPHRVAVPFPPFFASPWRESDLLSKLYGRCVSQNNCIQLRPFAKKALSIVGGVRFNIGWYFPILPGRGTSVVARVLLAPSRACASCSLVPSPSLREACPVHVALRARAVCLILIFAGIRAVLPSY